MAYYFFINGVRLPIPPSKMNTQIRNQNKTIELINESQVNILKDAGLTDISFEILLPNVKYPFAVYSDGYKEASYYLNVLEKLKLSKKPFQFIVSRKMPTGRTLPYTNMKVSLEEYKVKESADEGFDYIVSIELKQYRSYGTKTATIRGSGSGSATVKKESTRDSKDSAGSYIIQSGDTLWNIAKQEYGNALDWKQVYEANKDTIESVAKEHGKLSSSNGWWIFPGTEITLP